MTRGGYDCSHQHSLVEECSKSRKLLPGSLWMLDLKEVSVDQEVFHPEEMRMEFWFRLTSVNLDQTSGSLMPGGLLPVYLNTV